MDLGEKLNAAEAPVCDITMNAILESLEKYPKKKAVFKSFCKEYQLADMDELTEPLALEVLEIIDDQAYTRTIRAKKADLIIKAQMKLRDNVQYYLETNNEKFIILSQVEDCWLIAKHVTLIVYNKNDNPIFQPHETSLSKDYFIVFALKTNDEFMPNEIIGKFVSRGCKIIRVYSDIDIRGKLEAVQ